MAQHNVANTSKHKADQNLSGVFSLLWKHKLKVMGIFLFLMLATVLYLVTADREYRSEAKLFVRAGGQGLHLPSANNIADRAVGDAQQREVYAVAELLQSRLLAEKMVDQFGASKILDENVEKQSSPLGKLKKQVKSLLANLDDYNLNPLQKFGDRDEAIEEFQKQLKVLPTKTSSVISISYDFSDPKVAQEILESLLKSAMDEHFRIHLTPGSQAFFASQANRLRMTLSDLESRLRDLKNETGLASLEIQRHNVLNLIGTLEQDHLLTLTQLDSAEAEVENRRQQLTVMPTEIVAEKATDQPNSIGQLLRSKVYDLEVTEQDQASKLAGNHPTLVSTRERLAEARKLLRDEKQSIGITTGVNPNFQAFDLALRDKESTMEGLSMRIKSLSDKLQSARTEVQRLNAAEVDLSELQREIELVQANYKTYSENLEQTRINEELERAEISGLTVMQPPTDSPTPVSPVPLFALALGFLGACFASIGLVTLSEIRNAPSFDARSDRRVEPTPTEEPPAEITEPTKVILQKSQRKPVLPR